MTAAANSPRQFRPLAAEGLIGLTVEREFGGAGAGYVDALRVLGAVAKGEPSTALILFMTYAFHASPDKSDRWPKALFAIGAGGGGRARADRHVPRRTGAGHAGTRRSAQDHGPQSGWRMGTERREDLFHRQHRPRLVRRLCPHRRGEPAPGILLVDLASPGITILPEWDHLGMRATVSHKVVFDKVLVKDDRAVDLRRPENGPLPGASSALCGMRWPLPRSMMVWPAPRAIGWRLSA
jgi:alkylation response protein AidB-like acyl-CoA dehydrogenase